MIMCPFLASFGHLEQKLLPELINSKVFIPVGLKDKPPGLVFPVLGIDVTFSSVVWLTCVSSLFPADTQRNWYIFIFYRQTYA